MECLDLNVYFPDNSVLSEASYRGADPATLPSVDWLTGAALLVRSGLFRDLGGFDEAFFMYSEETDLQMRIHKSGYRIGVCPDAVFSHEHAHSTQRTDLRQVEFYKSLWYYFRKHHGRLHSSLIRLLLIIRSVAMGTIVLVRYSMDSQTRNHRLSPLFRLLAWSLRLAPRRQFRQTDIRHSPPSST